MMKVVVYEPDYDPLHRRLLRALARGIPGAVVRDARAYEPCDVAVIFGLKKNSFPKSWAKGEIVRQHAGRPVLVLERGYVRRDEYWSLGWNGINGRADHVNEDAPSDRWAALGVELRPWHGGDYFLVAGQVPWDVSVQHTDHRAWCRQTVAVLAGAGVEVRFRPHPLAVKRGADYGVPDRFLRPDAPLERAAAVVTFNSNLGVDATLAGTPVSATDEGSMARAVALPSALAVLNGAAAWRPDRTRWAAELAYAQWTEAELASGAAWERVGRRVA